MPWLEPLPSWGLAVVQIADGASRTPVIRSRLLRNLRIFPLDEPLGLLALAYQNLGFEPDHVDNMPSSAIKNGFLPASGLLASIVGIAGGNVLVILRAVGFITVLQSWIKERRLSSNPLALPMLAKSSMAAIPMLAAAVPLTLPLCFRGHLGFQCNSISAL